jgi:hypothetical protein
MAEGRTLDNSSSINYLLQDYSTSIEYFDKVYYNYHLNNIEIFAFLAFDNCERM